MPDRICGISGLKMNCKLDWQMAVEGIAQIFPQGMVQFEAVQQEFRQNFRRVLPEKYFEIFSSVYEHLLQNLKVKVRLHLRISHAISH
jgi:hypothetical protein